jgi:hypothetical protein
MVLKLFDYNEMERAEEEAVVTYFRMLFCLEGMKKTTRKSHKYSAKT